MTDSAPVPPAALATYSTEQVEQAAEMLLVEALSGDSRSRLTDFVFLNDNGAWWTYCPEVRRWQRNVQGEWNPGDPPAGRLLGPAWVAHLVIFGMSGGSSDEDEWSLDDEADDPGAEDGPQALAVAVAQIQDAFSAGRLDSSAAETILRRLYLLDGQWRAWTVGVRSGDWYLLTDRGWEGNTDGPEGHPPEDAADYARRVLEAQVPILVGRAELLPESIAPDWRPPQIETTPSQEPSVPLAESVPSAAIPDSAVPRAKSKRPGRRMWLLVLAAVFIPALIILALWLDYNVFVDREEMYLRGEKYRTEGTTAGDAAKAYKWLDRADRMAHDEATYSLGLMYLEGMGVRCDHSKAFSYFSRAANNYSVNAMLALAEMYEKGLHVDVDSGMAEFWRERARNTSQANF